jgi:hypothetical protein
MNLTDEIFEPENLDKLFRAIAELHHNLGLAFRKKRQGRKELWPASRNEIIEALVAIAWFCEKLEGFGCYTSVFNEFSSTLSDLDRGTIHAILVAKARKGGKGKPPDSTDIMCARCRVAIAVEYMMHSGASGKSKGDIAHEIALQHQSLKLLTRTRGDRGQNLSGSIVSWYDAFNQGEVKNQEARDFYRTYMHGLKASQRTKATSSADLMRIARRQLHLAANFRPISKDEALNIRNFIEPKRHSARR